MKVTVPEISWHNRDPVLALDIQPNPSDGIYRLATAGTDTHVVIWQLKILDNGGISVEALSDLTRHNRAVNAVRFSPDGEILATADDEAAIILWKKQEKDEADIFTDDSEKENRELWVIHKMLRGHLEDVYDISWSSCSQYLISGSVDNSAILWNVSKGKHISILKEHQGFVQGVAWDPMNKYVATLCSDRCCRIYNFNSKKLAFKIDKASLPLANGEDSVTEKLTRLFYDDTLKSFCRRLAFSPDGEVLLAPSGIVEGESGKISNATYLFSRYNFAKPAIYLPTKDKYTLAVRFSPVLYELKPLLKEEKDSCNTDDKDDCTEEWRKYSNLLDLPYRMVFAVATQNALFLYDTQQPIPFGKISNMHYTRLSDVAWSSDGRILVVSSTDGYCSLVSFSEDELGTPYKKSGETPQNVGKKVDNDVEMASVNSDKEGKTQSENSPNERKSSVKPIAVKRLDVSNKAGRRVSLTTLSSGNNKTGESLQASKPETQKINNQEDVTMEVEESKSSSGECMNADKSESDMKPPKSSLDHTPTKSESGMKPPKSSQDHTPTKSPRRVNLITLSSPKDKRKGSGKDPSGGGKVQNSSETENQSPTKTAKESLSPNRQALGSQKTPRRIPLTTVSSPKGKTTTADNNSPVKKAQQQLSSASSPKSDKAPIVVLDEEVTKRFEGDSESPAKTVKNLTPSKTTPGSSKTPRRVPLITLSSPKGKKKLISDSR